MQPPETARNAIHRFKEGGLQGAFRKGSSRPDTIHRAFDSEGAERLREMLHRRPRDFGKPTSSLWALDLAAEASFEEGLTEERVSGETIRATLAREFWGCAGSEPSGGSRAQTPTTKEKKAARPADRLDGARRGSGVGLRGREVWRSPVALPSLHTF